MAVRILGIDPGFGRVGYGVVEHAAGNTWKHVAHGCIETSPKKTFVNRLSDINEALEIIIKEHKPTRMAIEELFFVKNVTTGIQVGQARGVILLTGYKHGLPIDEFKPTEVKQSLTGYGRAEKGQMQKLVAVIFGLKEKVKSDDAADALAIALCSGQRLWLQNITKIRKV